MYMTSYISIVDDIGLFGPMILFILTVLMLRGYTKYFNIYLIFVLINTALHSILQKMNENDNYGAPSIDAQSVSFSTLYLYLVTKSKNLLIGSSFISVISLIVGYRMKQHSIKQLFTGVVVGCSVAYISYNLVTIFLTYR